MSAPKEAYLTLRDGERVDCLLEQIEPGKYQATPVRDVSTREVASAYIDVLPAKTSISFLLREEEG